MSKVIEFPKKTINTPTKAVNILHCPHCDNRNYILTTEGGLYCDHCKRPRFKIMTFQEPEE